MKRFFYSVILLTLLSSCQKEGIYHIVVCSTSDIHGAYFSESYTGEPVSTSLSNVSSYLKSVRAEGYDPILIDCGDNLQGDLAAYYYNYISEDSRHLFYQIAKFLKYDALVVGNHDIEAGHAVYDKFKSQHRFPYLAANAVIDDGSKDNGEPYFGEYTVEKRKGYKVAMIGMTNSKIKMWLSSSQWSGMTFLEITDIAQDIVDRIREKESPDVVILAIHSGTGEIDGGGENCALELASTLEGVDIIFNGHDHSPYVEMVKNPNGDIAVVNPSSKCQYVGRCDIYFNHVKGEKDDIAITQQLIPMADVPVDEEYDNRFKSQFEIVKAFATEPVVQLVNDISFEDVFDGPSSYMTLVHRVQLDASGADVSISAPLSTKGSIKAGMMNYQDITSLYRYENQLFVVEMKGSELKAYLEYSYDNWINRSAPSYNYDSAYGIDYKVYRNNPFGSRVVINTMSDGTSFDPDKSYSVAMTSYRASGGGGLLEKGAGINPDDLKIIEKYADIRSMIYDYLSSQDKYTPVIDNNWNFVD